MPSTLQNQKIKVDNTEITLYDIGTTDKFLSIEDLNLIIPRSDSYIPDTQRVALKNGKEIRRDFISLKTFERMLISNTFSKVADTNLLRNIYKTLYVTPFHNAPSKIKQKVQAIVKINQAQKQTKRHPNHYFTTQQRSFGGFVSLRSRFKNDHCLGVTVLKNKYVAEGKKFDTAKEAAEYYDDAKFKKYGEKAIPYLNYPDRYLNNTPQNIPDQENQKGSLDDKDTVLRAVKFDKDIWKCVEETARLYNISTDEIVDTAATSFFWINRLNVLHLENRGVKK